jgi:hypothetical protein
MRSWLPGPPRARCVDSARTGAEIKDVVVEVEFHLKILDDLAVEAVSEEDFRAACLRECSRRQRRIQLAARDTQCGRLTAGTLPRQTGLGIVRLRQIDQLSQRISLARIDVEPGITKIFRICFDFPLIGCMPRLIRRNRRALTESTARKQQKNEQNCCRKQISHDI